MWRPLVAIRCCGTDGTERTYQRHLLRRSYREDGKVRKETLANLSHLPDEAIAALRLALAGKTVVDAEEAFEVVRSLPHGHVAAAHAIARSLGFPGLLGPPCRQRDLAYALIVSQAVRPRSKLSTARWWMTSPAAATWAWPGRPPTRSTPRWTGCRAGRTPSRRRWPPGT